MVPIQNFEKFLFWFLAVQCPKPAYIIVKDIDMYSMTLTLNKNYLNFRKQIFTLVLI